jgi:hypothetical protein
MRRADWRARLTEYVVSMQGARFEPGRLDCALFAAGAVEAMTGEDHAHGLRGYRTLAGGYRKLQERGHGDHVALVASLFAEVPPSFAQAGDLAVVPGDDGPALGVIQGEHVYVMRPDGLGLVSRLSCERAFRV